MAWTANDIPDQSGRVAVVTGANGGLGLETARELARKGAHVLMAARDQDKAAAAEKSIREDQPDASLRIIPLDLGSLASVRSAADLVLADHDRVDLLINNAGLMAMPERRTADGFEMQLGVNHYGHWALTSHLLRALLAADDARVVTVTSSAHHMGRALDPKNPNLEGKYGPWKAYGNSKLANFHFALGLQQKLDAAGASAVSLAAHPGLSNTDLQSHTVDESGGAPIARFFHRMAASTGMSAAAGALPQLRAATDPNAQGGAFYGPRFFTNGPPVRLPVFRRSQKAIDILWQVSERETKIPLEVRPRG